MNAKWERIASFTLAAATVVALVIIGPTSGAAQKKGKGKKIPDLVRIEFLDPMGDHRIQSDGKGDYVDERLQEGDPGVEAYLFPSGNFALRLEGSGRKLTLDFSGITFPSFPLPGPNVEVRGMGTTRLHFDAVTSQEWLGGITEQECDDQAPYPLNDSIRGLLCITPGASRAHGFSINWDDLTDPNLRFKVRLRDDQGLSGGEDNIMVTRCCAADNDDPTKCKTSGLLVPSQCGSLPLPGEDVEFTWVYSTEEGSDLGIPTGATAQISSSTIKGKQKTTVYGLFEMPTEFVVVCKKGCP